MARPTTLIYSKTKVNKAADLLVSPPANIAAEQVYEALEIIQAFRDAHAYPMQKVRNGLVSFTNTCGVQSAVSQRHKRVPRILRKLRRMNRSMLARLEDIGGCRAVVASPDELERMYHHILKLWGADVVRDRDYITYPKEMGYRARHLVVLRDERRIEIQLRTDGQQRWANSIEELDARKGLNLKDGEGPQLLMRYFQLAGELIHAREYGIGLTQEFVDAFIDSRDAVIDAGYYTR